MRRSVPCPVLGPLWRSSGLWATTDPAFDGRRDAPPVATQRARRARDSQGLKPWPACSRCWLLRARWIGGPGMLASGCAGGRGRLGYVAGRTRLHGGRPDVGYA